MMGMWQHALAQTAAKNAALPVCNSVHICWLSPATATQAVAEKTRHCCSTMAALTMASALDLCPFTRISYPVSFPLQAEGFRPRIPHLKA